MSNSNLNIDKYIAKTFEGLEDILEEELISLGISKVEKIKRGVAFECDFWKMVECNLTLRTALRIYKPIAEFEIKNEKDVYSNCLNIEWDKIIKMSNTFSIESIVNTLDIKNTHYISLISKDAIADYFTKKYSSRPNVDIKNPDIRIQVHINIHKKCTISIDTSYDMLYKRGYKVKQTEASINEVLASAMILKSKFKFDKDFYNPMSGSGTLLCEAIMIGTNFPVNINRKKWTFSNFEQFDEKEFKSLKENLLKKVTKSEINYYGFDNNYNAVDLTKMNYYNLKLPAPYVFISKEDFFNFKPKSSSGIVFLNPPYDQRMTLNDAEFFYKDMGDLFKNQYKNFEVWMISNNKSALKKFGLKPDEKSIMLNGKLVCDYCKYSIY